MENTLDSILIEYGNDNSLTFKEFIDLDSKQLSEKEQKLQEVMKKLYQLNDRNPPLFQSFPKRKDGKKLTIDTKTLENCALGGIHAQFLGDKNKIEFLNISETNLLCTLAHELKHAEQESDQYRELLNHFEKENNGLAYQQIRFLEEAQAHAFGDFIVKLSNNEPIDWQTYEQQNIAKKLEKLFSEGDYKAQYDVLFPIKIDDTELSEIPESFHMSNKTKEEAKKALEKVPREKDKASHLLHLLIDYVENDTNSEELPNLLSDKYAVKDVIYLVEDLRESYPSHGKEIEKIEKALIKLCPNEEKENVYDVMMHTATHEGYTELLNLLIANDISEAPAKTALIRATKAGDLQTVEALLKANVDVNLKDNDGKTALMHAEKKKNSTKDSLLIKWYQKIIDKLVEYGAKSNTKQIQENTNGEKEKISLQEAANFLAQSKKDVLQDVSTISQTRENSKAEVHSQTPQNNGANKELFVGNQRNADKNAR